MREFPLLRRGWLCVLAVCWLVGAGVDCLRAEEPSRLPRTAAWELPEATVETLADLMVAGIDRFLLKETERASEERKKFWSRDLSSAPAYLNSVASQRERLQWIIGDRKSVV